ncbi:hypothetical protein [Candidatus Odyssella thessalonicensis]|uniref:hypothetical protein n=1 Tax=Candidatus Odyssella thessalonicensis TaxID=84647 RepID=UPI000225ABAF|nr:hypothetical protein [Candidatus Odyssella thessalonicensis]
MISFRAQAFIFLAFLANATAYTSDKLDHLSQDNSQVIFWPGPIISPEKIIKKEIQEKAVIHS